MDERHKDFIQKILLEYLNNPQYLCYPETDDSDSDYEPDDGEESEEDYEDSEEEPETDLSHLDRSNIITRGLYQQERDPYYSPPGPLVVETVKVNTETGERDPNLEYD
jgi:hypothetical protein